MKKDTESALAILNELKVAEITEIPSGGFKEDSLILAYTDGEGIGTTAFTKAKEVIGSSINITQITDKKDSGAQNQIVVKTRNGTTEKTETLNVYNGNGYTESQTLEDTTDINGRVEHHYKIVSGNKELLDDLNIDVKDGVGMNVTVSDGKDNDTPTHIVNIEQTDGDDKSFTVKDGVGVKSHTVTPTSATESSPKKNILNIKYTDGTQDSIDINDGISIGSHTKKEETDGNGLRTTTETISFQDGVTDTLTIKDGIGIAKAEQTKTSTTSGDTNILTLTFTDGTTSTINIMNGRAGKDFRIKKTYASITAMQDDYQTEDVEAYEFVMIDTGSVEDADTGKLYMRTESSSKADAWKLIGDLSGCKGETGVGIKTVTYAEDANKNTVVTFTMTDTSTAKVTVNRGAKGDRGASISSITGPATVDSSSGAKNTYTVNDSDGNKVGTFDVYNGGVGVNATNIPMSADDTTSISSVVI